MDETATAVPRHVHDGSRYCCLREQVITIDRQFLQLRDGKSRHDRPDDPDPVCCTGCMPGVCHYKHPKLIKSTTITIWSPCFVHLDEVVCLDHCCLNSRRSFSTHEALDDISHSIDLDSEATGCPLGRFFDTTHSTRLSEARRDNRAGDFSPNIIVGMVSRISERR